MLETTESCLLSPGDPPLVLLLLVLAGGVFASMERIGFSIPKFIIYAVPKVC